MAADQTVLLRSVLVELRSIRLRLDRQVAVVQRLIKTPKKATAKKAVAKTKKPVTKKAAAKAKAEASAVVKPSAGRPAKRARKARKAPEAAK